MKIKGSVYFIRCGSLIKVGFARDVGKRLSELQTGNPEPLTLVAVIPNCTPSAERTFHKVFAEARVRGEWFAYDGLKRIVRQIQSGAQPRTEKAIQHYIELPRLPPSRELNRPYEEVRKALRREPMRWTELRAEFIAKGGAYPKAVESIERRYLTKGVTFN